MDEINKEYRKITIGVCIAIILVVFVVSLVFLKIHLDENKVESLSYKDNSDLSYKVWLKENDYYDKDYIPEDNQYISNLIENIELDLQYQFELGEKLPYTYDYEVNAVATVSDDKTGKTVYEFPEAIVNRKTEKTSDAVVVNEKVIIDYNKYNDLIKEFVLQYELDDVKCQLNVNMDLNVSGDTKNFHKDGIADFGLTIPLVANTVSIDEKHNNIDAEQVFFFAEQGNQNNKWLIAAVAVMTLDLMFLLGVIIYAKKTETEEDKYRNEVKKILNMYDSYISRIKDEFNMEGYQILKVASFVDLLEIRDTMHVPIIMLGEEDSSTTCFMLPAPNNILYFFSIGIYQQALPTGEPKEEDNVTVSSSSNDVSN